MTQEERKKYFKFYRGEERCPDEWIDTPKGMIWQAEKNAEHFWENLSSGEWDKELGFESPRPLEATLEDYVVSTAQKFDPWNWAEVERIYKETKRRED